MSAEKKAIFTGLAAGIFFAVAILCYASAHAAPSVSDLKLSPCCATNPVTTVHPDGIVTPRPLSAVVVTSCSMAVALFIQLDATHLLRADPRQSDMFTAVDGQMVQTQAGPIPWDDAYKLAQSAVLSSHVVIPCTDGPSV